MLSGMIRRISGTAAAASIVAVAGLSAVGTTTTASAQTAGACVVTGSASITPGLGAVPTAESVSFNGNASPCEGLGVSSGSFSGSITCGLGGLVTCVPFAALNVATSPYGSCTGVLVQEGVVVETACTAGANIVSVDVFTSNNGTNLPVTSVSFTGVAAGATP